MTEIERTLTDTLSVLERELRQAQEVQGTIQASQQNALATHLNTLNHLQEQINSILIQQHGFSQHLKRLTIVYKKLKLLLNRLNDIIDRRQDP
ncbi:hypothetical protein [Solidesulfovibrio carbinoliphilus]|uniref:hypothetical protein n=1 Tax=Solidesulfovibrio carbinoliphilus TaxID=345370 RepID=UPI0018DED7A9|nr:hypothetical protein [Solidesulfovibrio carbinoliphilus]